MTHIAEQNHHITRGADFRLPFRVKPRGALVDSSTAVIRVILDDGTIYTNQGGTPEITALSALSQSAVTVTGAFTATKFVDAATALFATNRVSVFDTALIAGSTSNDGTYEIDALVSDTRIELDTVLTAEAALGTISCSRGDEWWELHLEEAGTLALAAGSYGYYLEFLLGDMHIPLRGVMQFEDP